MVATPPAHAVEMFHPNDLALYHRNPRIGSVAVIENSLRAHGQYKPVVVNRGTHTGRPNEVLAGNHTVKGFRNLLAADPDDPRWQAVAGYVIDVDDDQAARIVLVDNRSAEVGGFDHEVLADLLDGLPGLDGTGYTDADLEALLAGMDDSSLDTFAEPGSGNGSKVDTSTAFFPSRDVTCPSCGETFVPTYRPGPESPEEAGDV